MQSPSIPDKNDTPETPSPAQADGSTHEPGFDTPAKPIAEFAGRPDFPRCALGEHLDIGGFAGIVVTIVNQSIKVRPRTGTTQSFNSSRLKTLYGPRLVPVEPIRLIGQATPSATPVGEAEEATSPAPARKIIENPNFDTPVKLIAEICGRADFPACAYGAHVDFGGFVGVVVEIAKQSLKVRSEDGLSRSYNGDFLRKRFGQS